jgi:hypothetical protein
MPMVDRAHHDRVDAALLLEQLAEVGIRSASAIVAGALPAAVIPVHDLLAGLTSGNAGRCVRGMGQLDLVVRAEPLPSRIGPQQLANVVAELVVVPLRIAGAAPVGIAHGDALHVGLAQEVQHHAKSLRADANERDIDLRGRRGLARPAEHVARHDRERGSTRARRAQKLTSREWAHCRLTCARGSGARACAPTGAQHPESR